MKSCIRMMLITTLWTLLAACTGAAASTATTATPAAGAKTTHAAVTPEQKASRSATEWIEPTPNAVQVQPSASTDEPAVLKPTITPGATPTPRPTLKPDQWETLPVIPRVSDSVQDIYRRGVALGNNPQAFSKIGDCGSTPAWFLGDFDRGPRYYELGKYRALEAVIEAFQGSFDRTSLAARSGFNVSALFTPLWSDRTFCNPGEAPLECEYRVHRPILAFITLGVNDVWRPEEFEPQMRKTIEYTLQQGIIPILATKADNQEGDGSINATIARLAWEYDLPLWNYWAAVNALPNQGLQEDGAHLTWGPNNFDDPEAMNKAWPVRNLTALQALDAVWKKLQSGAQ